MKIKETTLFQDLTSGDLKSSELRTYYKTIKETAIIYQNQEAAALSEDMAYYVTSDAHEGETAMNWGVTCMYPTTVDGECCMTRGHFHADTDYPEYYCCIKGEGHLLCWDGEDDVVAYHMIPGSLQYIQGRYAHRLINTGEGMFKVIACWATKAGHNYAAIEKRGFPVRVYKKDGELIWKKENADTASKLHTNKRQDQDEKRD